jgi:hypothetical protein
MIYYLGLILGKRFRVWYWRTHGKRYYWGIIRSIKELPQEPVVFPTLGPSEKEFDDFLEKLFGGKGNE